MPGLKNKQETQAKKSTASELALMEGELAVTEEGLNSNEKTAKYLITANNLYKKSPGFFTPYRNFGDLGETLAGSVLVAPAFSIAAGILAIGAAGAAVTTIASLFVSGGAGLVGLFKDDKKHVGSNALKIAAAAALFSTSLLGGTIAVAVLTPLVLAMGLAMLTTRSAATLLTPMVNYIVSSIPLKKELNVTHLSMPG